MILFTFLLITLLILSVIAVIAVGIGGTAVILVFGDVIICIALIAFIMKHIFGKKK